MNTRVASLSVVVIACGLSLTRAAPARADDSVREEPDAALRLEGWLRLRGEEARTQRLVSGVVRMGAGALIVTLGVATDLDFPFVRTRELGAAMWVGLGASAFALGVLDLFGEWEQEARWARFQRMRAEGLSADELLRFEGELSAASDHSRFLRRMLLAGSVAMGVFGGVFLIGGTTLDGDDEATKRDRLTSYVFGGTLVGVGLVMAITSLVPTGPEGDWEDYQRGLAPAGDDAPTVRATLTPLITESGGGLGVLGSF